MALFGGKSFADVLGIIGAGLKDASPDSQGGNLAAMQGMMEQRQKKAMQDAFYQRLAGMAQGDPGLPGAPMKGPGLDGAPVSGMIGASAPRSPMNINDPRMMQIAAEAAHNKYDISPILEVMRMQQPKAASHIEGPDGIYEIAPGQPPRKVTSYPARPDTTPGKVNPQTGKWEWAPGYLESQSALSGVRRDAVVSRPMPRTSNGHGGGGHGGSTGLPPGYVPR